MAKTNRYLHIYFLLIGFETILCLLTVIMATFFCRHIQWVHIMIAFVLVMPFIYIYLQVKKGRLNTIKSLVLAFLLAFCCFGIFIYNIFSMIISDNTKETKNVNSYQKILEVYGYPDSEIYFFPSEIPSEATNIELYERPQFLQGGAGFYLKTEYTEKDFPFILEKINSQFQKTFCFSEKRLQKVNEDNEFLVEDGYYISTQFLEKFKLSRTAEEWQYYIYSNNNLCEEASWNHGKTAGIAVNDVLHIIIYFYEQW